MESQQLLSKLDQLFAQRQINTYAQHMGLSEEGTIELLDILKGLQIVIYEIDQLLEDHREIDPSIEREIDQRRLAIERMVGSMVKEDEILTAGLVNRLWTFFQMEVQIREGVSPITFPIDAFYALKICDIHLQRELINFKANKEVSPDVRIALEHYDKVGEVIDDLEDIEEDVEAINSNRFLLQAYEIGLEQTKNDYLSYIDQIEKHIIPHNNSLIELLGEKAQSPLALIQQAKRLINDAKLPTKTPLLVRLLSIKEGT